MDRDSSTPSSSPGRGIQWTGERCVPWTDNYQVIYEHYHRYALAATLSAGQQVVDLASGEGYGSHLLAQNASSVLGIDIDEPSIRHARDTHIHPGLEFRVGSMLDIEAFHDQTFDRVVCLEALEHIDDHDTLLQVVRHILVPGGIFIVSTPDTDVYSGVLHNDNPFHTHELTRPEFHALLSSHFPHVTLLTQMTVAGSSIRREDWDGSRVHTLELRKQGEEWTVGSTTARPPYLLAFASDTALPAVSDSLLADPDLHIVREPMRRIARLQTTMSESSRHADQLRAQVDALKARLRSSEEESRQVRDRLVVADERLKSAHQQLLGLSQELTIYENAATIRLARKMANSIDRLLPPGTPVRRLATRSVRTMLGMRGSSPSRGPKPDLITEDVVVPPRSVPFSSAPLVSVVVPVHNQWPMTCKCLHSLVNADTTLPIEILVVDDASTDATPARLAEVAGLRTIRLEDNVGFTLACNAAVAEVKSPYVVLLNNDTEVQTGWLDALYDTATALEDVGLVGARLIYPDGSLQEAGGIIFGDGNAWNYGRGFSGDDPRCLHRRTVDYVSGAAMLIKKEFFTEIGGFDSRFAPAYYEDVDLAFSARAAGLRVIYEPNAIVVHHEGASHGTDVAAGLKSYQRRNRSLFAEKWRDQLSTQGTPGSPIDLLRNFGAPRRLLVIDYMVPRPDRDAGSRRMRILLDILQDFGYAVTFIPDNGASFEPYISELRGCGIEVLHGPPHDQLERIGTNIDSILISRLAVAEKWIPVLRKTFPDTPIIFDTVDLHHVRESRRADLVGTNAARSTARTVKRRELAMVAAADSTLVVSSVERDTVLAEIPSALVAVVPTVELPADRGEGFGSRSDLLFVGSFDHPPNIDAVRWFTNEVLPLVRRKRPDIRLKVVGSGPLDDIKMFAGAAVEIVGWVHDLEPIYAQALVSVAPIRYGAGVKGKIGDALRHGLPVVSTPLGVEGMGLRNEHHVLLAESPEAFADQVVRMASDRTLWEQLSEQGYEEITRRFSSSAAAQALGSCLEDIHSL